LTFSILLSFRSYWVATQFQPSLARKAFPCFDEPAFRAKFELSIGHPTTHTALSNTATLGFQDGPEFSPGDDIAWTLFFPSHHMPTYLVAFVVAPLKSTVTLSSTIPRLKIFAMDPDLKRRKAYADTANIFLRAVKYADNYFKLDLTRANELFFGLRSSQTALSKEYVVALPVKQPIHSESPGLLFLR